VNDPGRVEAVFGDPDASKIATTYVEQFNDTVRQWCKRMTRNTDTFLKNCEPLEAALALESAHFNFCRRHGTLKATLAMAAGLADHLWTVEGVLENAYLRRAGAS